MSSPSEDKRELIQQTELSYEKDKKARISYTRDFLLSLSELDVCKRLPSGFDQSLLSEFEDTSQDRYRISGFASQGYRRNEYGSSPPTRADTNSFSRYNQGRWDSRSSGRSDRDCDSQSDRDSDSGRRYINQTQKPWKGSEHDGLLGSGSFPRPPGFSGSSAPKFRVNQPYQLNKSNEPYHPPRPYKAVPLSRRDTNDSFNDETFGSSDCTNEDRAEEERKRRASFELMRKEQQKAFQERQKSNPAKLKDDFDITELLEDSKENERLPTKISESFDAVPPTANQDSNKASFSAPTLVSRPLVPPGFSGTMVEKSVGAKLLPVVGNEPEGGLLHFKESQVVNEALGSQEQQQGQIDRSEEQLSFPNNLSVSKKSYKFLDLPGRTKSTSILDKLFGNALTINDGGTTSLIKDSDVQVEDALSPQTGQSSKFAQWFLEEEKKSVGDVLTREPKDLLSLIVGSEKGPAEAVDVHATENIQFSFTFPNAELSEKHNATNLKSSSIEVTDDLLKTDKSETVHAVLTCEDLEQSMLSGLDENSSVPPVEKWSSSEQSKLNIDDHASKHLLSLLKNDAAVDQMTPFGNPARTSLDKRFSNELASTPVENSRVPDADSDSNSGKPLTLETLFGSAFMKELQSVGAASSGASGSVGPVKADIPKSHDFPFPILDDTLLSSEVETLSRTKNHEAGTLSHGMPSQNELVSKLGGFDRSVDVNLPEENCLIAVGDSLRQQSYVSINQERTVDITEKLAALNSVCRHGRPPMGGQDCPPLPRGPYDARNPDIQGHNLHIQSSLSHSHDPLFNHVASMVHPLDFHSANINPHMKVVAPENILRHEIPNHQIFSNMLQPPLDHANGLTGYDHAIRSPVFQQMPIAGNLPPNHLLYGFPRGAQPPFHTNGPMTGYVQNPNPLQGFPFGQSPPNIGSGGLSPQGADLAVRNNNPEALQRLFESARQSHASPVPAHARGNMGIEHGMGFGYR